MENDLAHAKRLEDSLTMRADFANLDPAVAAPSEGRTNAPQRARQDNSAAGNDVEMRSICAGKRRWSQVETTIWCAVCRGHDTSQVGLEEIGTKLAPF